MNFAKVASRASEATGSPWAFTTACAVIIGWAILGPLVGFSDTWQLVVNTATTIVTFLMVFLLQNSQNDDTREIKAALQAMVERFDLEAEKQTRMEEQ